MVLLEQALVSGLPCTVKLTQRDTSVAVVVLAMPPEPPPGASQGPSQGPSLGAEPAEGLGPWYLEVGRIPISPPVCHSVHMHSFRAKFAYVSRARSFTP